MIFGISIICAKLFKILNKFVGQTTLGKLFICYTDHPRRSPKSGFWLTWFATAPVEIVYTNPIIGAANSNVVLDVTAMKTGHSSKKPYQHQKSIKRTYSVLDRTAPRRRMGLVKLNVLDSAIIRPQPGDEDKFFYMPKTRRRPNSKKPWLVRYKTEADRVDKVIRLRSLSRSLIDRTAQYSITTTSSDGEELKTKICSSIPNHIFFAFENDEEYRVQCAESKIRQSDAYEKNLPCSKLLPKSGALEKRVAASTRRSQPIRACRKEVNYKV
jgi:hypothetical protein